MGIEIVPVTVIIPTYCRSEVLCQTLARLATCCPLPSEVIVHVDAGDNESSAAVHLHFPKVRVIQSATRQGPGGGRNRLVECAGNEIIASHDDDSWPLRVDFFAEALRLFNEHPDLALLACHIVERDEQVTQAIPADTGVCGDLTEMGSFVGCGCIFRQSVFRKVGGYVALERAYGMEEADLSLKLLDDGFRLWFCRDMQVFHDCDRATRHAERQINAAQITNTGLLAFLRYPIKAWPWGLLQVINRVRFSIGQRRFAGIMAGLSAIPSACWRHRSYRRTVGVRTVTRSRRLRTPCRHS